MNGVKRLEQAMKIDPHFGKSSGMSPETQKGVMNGDRGGEDIPKKKSHRPMYTHTKDG